MPTPSQEIIQLLSAFSVAFTRPTFRKALVLLYGTILAPGRRTVTAALRMTGHRDDRNFSRFHRFLNRDHWSPWLVSRVLLGLVVAHLVPLGAGLMLIIDDTLERRRGPEIKLKGWCHDPLLAATRKVAVSLGVRWVCLAVLVTVPWCQRPWALPIMVVPAPTAKNSQARGRRHRTLVDRAMMMVERVRRWQPDREIVLVADSAYAAMKLVRLCQDLCPAVKLVSRLPLDAVLHDLPSPQPASRRGPKPKKGPRQPLLSDRLADPLTPWQQAEAPWYGGGTKQIELVTGTSLWYRAGFTPAPVRWVLLRCPHEGSVKPMAFFCSDQAVTALQIIASYVGRWNLEVTFEELRAFLGFETQRGWADRTIERTTPCLFGIFSLVTLMAKLLHQTALPVRQAAWYPKVDATFSDALAAVRLHLWAGSNCVQPGRTRAVVQFPASLLATLLEAAAYAA